MRKISLGTISISFLFAVLFLTYPYVFRQFLPVPGDIVFVIIGLGIFALMLLWHRRAKKLPNLFNFCIVTQIIVWLFYCVLHRDPSYLTRIVYLLFIYAVMLTFHNWDCVKKFIKLNNIAITAQAFLGLFAFILVFIGLLTPFFEFSNVDGRTGYCFGLTCTNVYFANIIRVAGFFDEPGAFAFWGVYSLVLNNLYIKNVWVERILIVCLFSTLSMAYIIQVALYLFFFKFKLRFNSQTLIPLFLVGALVLGVYSAGEDSEVYKMTFGRFVLNDYGELETNRDAPMESALVYFKEKPIFGYGATNVEAKGVYVADNPFETLAVDGIFGTIVIYLPLLIIFLLNKNHKEVIFTLLILCAGYLQRPFHIFALHYVMLYAFLYLGVCENKLGGDSLLEVE